MTDRQGTVVGILAGSLAIASAAAMIFALEAPAAPSPDAPRIAAVASHYGPPDEPAGQPVACGRGRMPAGVHGAAHKTLPCGTRIGVCLPDLSRCVEARIVDRGPYVAGRDVDLHGLTFSAIAPLSLGVIRVVIRVQNVKRCVPKWVKTYWRPAQGLRGKYAPTCGTAAAR